MKTPHNPNENFIPFALPEIHQEEIDEVVKCLKSGWLTSGRQVQRFEKMFAEFIGVSHAISVNSATAGLHLALDAIGLKRGDKVIVPVYTFTATAEVVRYFDADPIFCDVDEETYNIDPEKIRNILESASPEERKKIKAVIPVHIAGLSCDMDAIQKIAREFNLKIIEDAAHALPATYKGQMIGTIGDLTVYSFYATKTITTGEGGMVVTKNEDYARRMSIMRLHGFDRNAWDRYQSERPSWYYEIVAPGFKYNMTDLAASIGIHQLGRARAFKEKRKEIAKKYNQHFSTYSKVKLPPESKAQDTEHCFHLYMLRLPEKVRDQFIKKMFKLGSGCSVHFIPLHIQPYWKDKYNLSETDFPCGLQLFKSEVSLPIYSKMNDMQVEKVIQNAQQVFNELGLK